MHEAREFVRMAVEALSRYRLRTSLSVLGVVLGVAAVIAMMSVVEGARRDTLTQLELLGLDNVILRSRPILADAHGARGAGLVVSDAETLPPLTPLARRVSPLIERYLPLSRAGERVTARVLGIRASYQAIVRLRASRGRLLSPVDDMNATRVCVLGHAVATRLFGHREPVGDYIRIGSEYYEVAGVLAEHSDQSPASSPLSARDLDDVVLAPIAALEGQSATIMPGQRLDELWIQIEDGAHVQEVAQIIDRALTRLHEHVRDFDVVIPRELLAQRYRTQRTFAVVVGSVAVIALLVGGIGIMNMMLMSVTERTTEIGLRRTVGATRRHITFQFLTESMLMTLGGGACGIVVGSLTALGITAYAGWRTEVSLPSVGLGFVVSASVGLAFGLYPAMKAARLEPVDAVRYE